MLTIRAYDLKAAAQCAATKDYRQFQGVAIYASEGSDTEYTLACTDSYNLAVITNRTIYETEKPFIIVDAAHCKALKSTDMVVTIDTVSESNIEVTIHSRKSSRREFWDLISPNYKGEWVNFAKMIKKDSHCCAAAFNPKYIERMGKVFSIAKCNYVTIEPEGLKACECSAVRMDSDVTTNIYFIVMPIYATG